MMEFNYFVKSYHIFDRLISLVFNLYTVIKLKTLPLFWPVIACNILNDLDGIELPVYLFGSMPAGLSDGGTYILDSIGSTKK